MYLRNPNFPIMRTRFSIICSLVLLFSIPTTAQQISIKKVELQKNTIIVSYDLEDSNPNAEYLLNLYASTNNFSTALSKVTGAIGPGVRPGPNKQLQWRISEEIGPYKGKLSLEIKGKLYVPIVRVEAATVKKSYKRGKSYDLVWRPSDPTGQVNIELYKGEERVSGENSLANNGRFTWHIPAGTKAGKDYRIKFTNTKDSDDVVYTQQFHISPKIPLLLKLLPAAAVGGAVMFMGGGSDGGTDNDEGGGSIPNPPSLPSGG